MSEQEGLDQEKLQELIGNYLFTEQEPMRDDVIGMMKQRPGLRERASTAERITNKILDFVKTFVSEIAA